MNRLLMLALVLITTHFDILWAVESEKRIPGIAEFLLDEAHEIALAKSAAPAKISARATILVLQADGYKTVIEGGSDFVCLVIRSWGGPAYFEDGMYDPNNLVPECLDATAVEIILPLQEFRTQLAINKTPPKEANAAVKKAIQSGRFQRIENLAFSYMLSNAMMYGKDHSGNPHIMLYFPDTYTNDMIGGLSWKDQVLFIEGGVEQPYTAAVIYGPGIDPVYTE